MEYKLKLVTDQSTQGIDSAPFIYNAAVDSPVLAYYENGVFFHVLNKGGSPIVNLITCSDLKEILDKYMFKGTKYIASTYDPILYYLFPGISDNDDLFTSDNDFIPTLSFSENPELIRLEVDGFSRTDEVRQRDVRCMKVCDSWFNNLTEYEAIVSEIDARINNIFGYYKNYEVSKEVEEETGGYSADLSKTSLVVSLIPDSSYTDTINLEDWVLGSKKGTSPISGKLDISYMYSIGGVMYGGMQTIKAFQYEENVTSRDVFMNFGESCPVQIEYIDYILRIYPLVEEIDEVVFTDCTLTIGVL